ncbi:hypothetical protein DFQ28_001312 [Apophysomyces sp. BC1034]|nr:hypothetical protein DFQ28_001312 [Apophysomyces sp. BC1034]
MRHGRPLPTREKAPAFLGVIAALVGALGAFVIDPGEHDHPARCAKPEKQPVLLKKLGPKPVLVLIAEGAALAVFRSRRVLRDDIERQFGDCRQSLGGVLLNVSERIFFLQGLNAADKYPQPLDEPSIHCCQPFGVAGDILGEEAEEMVQHGIGCFGARRTVSGTVRISKLSGWGYSLCLDAPRKRAVETLKQAGFGDPDQAGVSTQKRGAPPPKKIMIQNDLTNAVWDPLEEPALYRSDKKIKKTLVDTQRGIEFREFLSRHARYNVASEMKSKEKSSQQLTFADSTALWKKTSQAGLDWQDKAWDLHHVQ